MGFPWKREEEGGGSFFPLFSPFSSLYSALARCVCSEKSWGGNGRVFSRVAMVKMSSDAACACAVCMY